MTCFILNICLIGDYRTMQITLRQEINSMHQIIRKQSTRSCGVGWVIFLYFNCCQETITQR